MFLIQLIRPPAARKLSGCAARSSAPQDSCGEGRATLAAAHRGGTLPVPAAHAPPTRILVHEVVISAAHIPQVKLHEATIKSNSQCPPKATGQPSTGKREEKPLALGVSWDW